MGAQQVVNKKYVKLYLGNSKLLGFTELTNDLATEIGYDVNVKSYDKFGRLIGTKKKEKTPPHITYISTADADFTVIGEQIPFVWQEDKWVATEGENAFLALQFVDVPCEQGVEYDLGLSIDGDVEIDDEACTTEGFPYVTIVRSKQNASGVVSGTSQQGNWQIIYPIG